MGSEMCIRDRSSSAPFLVAPALTGVKDECADKNGDMSFLLKSPPTIIMAPECLTKIWSTQSIRACKLLVA